MTIAKTFDAVFDKFRDNIPLEFLKALAFSASGLNPSKSAHESAGLFMISVPALTSYDKKFGGSHVPKDLADPILNTQIAVWILKNIVTYYASNFPRSMKEDWTNKDFVALVVHGYNVGYREPNGVGAAVKQLEKIDPKKVSLDTVAQAAKGMKLPAGLYNTKALNFAKSVTNLYLGTPKETAVPDTLPIPSTIKASRGGSGLGLAAIVGIPFIAFALMGKRRR